MGKRGRGAKWEAKQRVCSFLDSKPNLRLEDHRFQPNRPTKQKSTWQRRATADVQARKEGKRSPRRRTNPFSARFQARRRRCAMRAEKRDKGKGYGTSLSRSHEIAAASNDGDGVLLDGRGLIVAREQNVGHQEVVQLGVREGGDGSRSALSLKLDLDFVVLVEVDTSVGAREEHSLVGQILVDETSLTVPLLNRGLFRSAARSVLSVVASTIAATRV